MVLREVVALRRLQSRDAEVRDVSMVPGPAPVNAPGPIPPESNAQLESGDALPDSQAQQQRGQKRVMDSSPLNSKRHHV